ncbi:MAG: hypothetical protein ACI85O_003472 [Saprospiraceae bacterium]|jgi:hypothetical protein
MKTNNHSFSILLLFCFVFISNNTFAQSDKQPKGLFVDFDVSAIFVDDDLMGHAAFASGYRFNKKMAAGLEFRSAGRANIGNNTNMAGIGAVYRYTDKWFLGKVTLGKVLKSFHGEDSDLYWENPRGGFYYSLSLAYRSQRGFLIGLCYTGVQNNKFDFYIPDDTGELVLAGVFTAPFGAFGIMLGAAFPGSGKKWD